MNTCSDPNNFRKLLEVETLERTSVSDFHIIPVVTGKHYLVDRFIESLNLAASISSCPSSLRICHLSDFFTELRLDSLWRRIGISLSNFRIVLVSIHISQFSTFFISFEYIQFNFFRRRSRKYS